MIMIGLKWGEEHKFYYGCIKKTYGNALQLELSLMSRKEHENLLLQVIRHEKSVKSYAYAEHSVF